MGDLTRDSERILGEGRALVRDNRTGGRHRKVAPIGEGSRDLRAKFNRRKLVRVFMAALAIVVGTSVLGTILGGIGIMGLLLAIVIAAGVLGFLAAYPQIKEPRRADLTKTQDARKLVSQTELWLEHQAPALPAPAARIVNDMGVQLDALGLQLEGIEATHPAAQQVRKLVGEHLPETIDSYRRIPAHLRGEERAGATPDEQITDSLGKISKEIDHVTRQLADGHLDDLAIKTRYLDYAYGDRDALEDHSEPKDR